MERYNKKNKIWQPNSYLPCIVDNKSSPLHGPFDWQLIACVDDWLFGGSGEVPSNIGVLIEFYCDYERVQSLMAIFLTTNIKETLSIELFALVVVNKILFWITLFALPFYTIYMYVCICPDNVTSIIAFGMRTSSEQLAKFQKIFMTKAYL